MSDLEKVQYAFVIMIYTLAAFGLLSMIYFLIHL